jgi:hypothetical protein
MSPTLLEINIRLYPFRGFITSLTIPTLLRSVSFIRTQLGKVAILYTV